MIYFKCETFDVGVNKSYECTFCKPKFLICVI